MKKVLILSTIGLNYVGITSVIKNYISAMDITGLEFCFVAFPEIPESLKADFEKYGMVSYVSNRKRSFSSYLSDILGLMKQVTSILIRLTLPVILYPIKEVTYFNE